MRSAESYSAFTDRITCPSMRYLLSTLCLLSITLLDSRADEPVGLYVHGPGVIETSASLAPEREIGSAAIALSPGLSLDETLRAESSVNSFRRLSSVFANPTTQGASVRGVGGSGASRTLVLLDGLPMNDPFGGWVYWSRAESFEIERIRMLPAWEPPHFASLGLSGPVSIITRKKPQTGGALSAAAGNLGTFEGHALMQESGVNSCLLSGGYFESDGYVPLRSGDRGPIDRRLDTSHYNAALSASRDLGKSRLLSGALDIYADDKGGGTDLTGSDAKVLSSSVSLDDAGIFGGQGKAAAYAQRTVFRSDFSTQSPDRLSETPALHQRTPAFSAGLLTTWQANVGESIFGFGADMRHTEGETDEDFRFSGEDYLMSREAGGRQTAGGAQISIRSQLDERLSAYGAVRAEWWKSGGLFLSEEEHESGLPTRFEDFGSESGAAFLPKLGLGFRVSDGFELRSAMYHSKRAPTLNELVRPFRVRNDITAANADLDPEKLFGVEGGALFEKEPLSADISAYYEVVEDQVVNVTKGRGPGTVEPCGPVPEDGACRQRENVDRVAYTGIESSLNYQLLSTLRASLKYFLNVSEILDASEKELEGKEVPHAPEHQGSLDLVYQGARFAALFQVRYLGSQFEDDQNTLRLNDAVVLSIAAETAVLRDMKLFVKADNITGRRYAVAKSAEGLETISPPLIVRAGLRTNF